MSCHSKKCSTQSCPDSVPYLADAVESLKRAMAALQTQVGQLKTRTDFIWCKAKPLVEADLAERMNELESDLDAVESDLDAIQADVDSIQSDTEILRTCGVLTLDCESSDSLSSSFSESFSSSV